eukprot:4677442-Pyramimonas_sp.AAC.1
MVSVPVRCCFGTVQDSQGAAVTASRGIEVPQMGAWHDAGSSTRNSQVGVGISRMVFWRASGSSNGCPPTGLFPQWQ